MFSCVDNFSTVAQRYDVLLCDVWGVVHNGLAAYAEAGDALARFRAGGGTVVLITNAPRPSGWVVRQLDRLGVPREAYDAVTSSGDVTREVMAERSGSAVFHIGPERDLSIFEGLDVRFTLMEEAEYVVCTGLFDDTTETPEDYREMIEVMGRRKLFMLCANPDLVVERGNELVYCAGAIADLYVATGGEVLYAGKPHRPIYDAALAAAATARGDQVAGMRVLAIGDSLRTDITGARALGLDALFVLGGIHAEELGDRPPTAALTEMFTTAGITPQAVTPRLVW